MKWIKIYTLLIFSILLSFAIVQALEIRDMKTEMEELRTRTQVEIQESQELRVEIERLLR